MEILTAEQQTRFTTMIEKAAHSMQIELDSEKIDLLLRYLGLFIKWNKTYNLSAIRNPEEMLTKHLLDSLAIVPYLAEAKEVDWVLDVGTGGGLPGIPLSICFPEKRFTLLDSAGKKIRFLYQVKQSLNLDNVSLENLRVEKFLPKVPFDIVVSRAFASIKDMTSLCQHLLADHGHFWAMKGIFPEEELRELEKKLVVEDNHNLNVPGLTGDRCLVILSQNNES